MSNAGAGFFCCAHPRFTSLPAGRALRCASRRWLGVLMVLLRANPAYPRMYLRSYLFRLVDVRWVVRAADRWSDARLELPQTGDLATTTSPGTGRNPGVSVPAACRRRICRPSVATSPGQVLDLFGNEKIMFFVFDACRCSPFRTATAPVHRIRPPRRLHYRRADGRRPPTFHGSQSGKNGKSSRRAKSRDRQVVRDRVTGDHVARVGGTDVENILADDHGEFALPVEPSQPAGGTTSSRCPAMAAGDVMK